MTRRAPLLSLAVLGGLAAGLAGCSGNTNAVSAKLLSPAALVPFYGVTTKSLIDASGRPMVQGYLAVASAGGDELRVVDTRDLQVVLGPGLVFPLSTPTDTRPLLLAAARLQDDVVSNVVTHPLASGGDGSTTWNTTYLADALVAVSGGERKLQLIDTWATTAQVFDTIDLAPLLTSEGAEILSLTGVPARPADGIPARVIAAVADAPAGNPAGALTVGKLVVVEFGRVTADAGEVRNGVTYPKGSAIPRAIDPVANVLELGFLPSDVQVEPDFPVTANVVAPSLPNPQVPDGLPATGTRLLVASREPIAASGSTYGVALYQTNPAGSAALIGDRTYLDAKGPTLSVAAGWVDERVVDQNTGSAAARYCSPDTFQGQPQLRVYAGLAPEGCGVDKPIACGLVTLDPGTGQLAADPAESVVIPPSTVVIPVAVKVPPQTFRAPVALNGNPLHITIVHAPAGYWSRSWRLHPQGWPLDPAGNDSSIDPNLPSQSCPTRAPAVPAGSGKGLNLMRLIESSGIRYTSAFAAVASSDGRVYWIDLARWAPPAETDPTYGATTRATVTATSVVTSTVTLADGTIRTGAALGMRNLLSPSAPPVNGTYTLPDAIYAWPGFTDSDTWSVSWQGALSRLDAQSGVLLQANGQTYLAAQSPLGDDQGGGGWVVNAAIADPALGVRVGDGVGVWTRANPTGCKLDLTDVDPPTAQFPRRSYPATVEAVLSAADAAALGLDAPGGAVQLHFPDDETAACFAAVRYHPAAPVNPVLFQVRAAGFVLLNGKLGYLGRPQLGTLFAAGWANEDDQAATPEQRALARKARRLFYPSNSSPCPYAGSGSTSISDAPVGCYPGFPYLADPLQPGPIIFFKLELMPGFTESQLRGGDGIAFTTQSGRLVTGRIPTSGGTLPAQPISFDWSLVPYTTDDHSNDPIRLAVPFLDDQLYFFSPSATNAYDVTIK